MPYHMKRKIDEIENDNEYKYKANKELKSVRFDTVDVYYFDRQQGFCSIPSTGLNTLGNVLINKFFCFLACFLAYTEI